MMPMVIPFCPILYSFDFSSVLIFVCFHKTQGFIFRQVQFFHYIHQLPVFTQLICNGTGSCHYSTADFVQHSECFFRYILCISQIPINETIRYILLFHFQFPKFRLFVIEQAFATIYILLQAFFSIFFFYKIISGLISLFYINGLILQCLVRQRIIKKTGLWNNMFYIYLFTENLFFRYILIGIQCFISIIFQLFIKFVTDNIIAAHVHHTKFILQQFTDLLMLTGTLCDSFRQFLTFFGTLL